MSAGKRSARSARPSGGASGMSCLWWSKIASDLRRRFIADTASGQNVPMIPIKELSRFEAPLLERHFLALPSEDRRLRFGAVLSDQAVCAYLRNIDYERDALFGVWGDELQIVGAAHLARLDGHAELGVSVLPGHRGLGLGG